VRISLADLDDPRVADYRSVPDPELLRRRGLFVAEGREVVRRLLASTRLQTRSLLVTPTALASLEGELARCAPEPAVYVAPLSLFRAIVGFNVHRGCLALGQRPPSTPLEEMLADAPAVCTALLVHRVGNPDNMGGLFRNARAFGAQIVVVGPGCADPFYRKAIRVSMGAVFSQPFAGAGDEGEACRLLRQGGFRLAALAPGAGGLDLDEAAGGDAVGPRVALMVGAEGEGLSRAMLAEADVRVRIRMAPEVDSINVATAAAIALHRFAARARTA
jgi:tRNA G18 (ribose-2'-O)-methylase SpoU